MKALQLEKVGAPDLKGKKSRQALTFTAGLLVAAMVLADAPITAGNAAATVTGGVGTTITFPLTRTGDTSAAATVGYTTIDGSAIGGTDYTATIGSVTIPAGATTANVPSIAVSGESGIRPDKQFSLQLMGVGGTGPVPIFNGAVSFPLANNKTTGGPNAIADFNGDGKPDVVVVEQPGSASGVAGDLVSVFLNTTAAGASAPSFASASEFALGTTLAPSLASVATADFNGDGKPDLVGVQINQSGVRVGSISAMLNTTAAAASIPTFAPPVNFTANFSSEICLVGDFNLDGRPDVVGVTADGLGFLLNTAASGATAPSFQVVDYPVTLAGGGFISSIVVGDFNGDGKPDVALLRMNTSAGTFSVEVLLNTAVAGAGTLSFSPPSDFPLTADSAITFFQDAGFSLVQGDVNGDGKPDLLVGIDGEAVRTDILFNQTVTGDATPGFAAEVDVPLKPSGLLYGTADLNGDGKLDLLTTAGILTNVAASNATAPGFAVRVNTDLSIHSGEPADFNGDGKPDLVATDGVTSKLYVQFNATQPGPAVQPGAPNVSATGTIHYQSSGSSSSGSSGGGSSSSGSSSSSSSGGGSSGGSSSSGGGGGGNGGGGGAAAPLLLLLFGFAQMLRRRRRHREWGG